MVSPCETTEVGRDGHGTATASVHGRIDIVRRLVALGLPFSSHLACNMSLSEAKLVRALVLPLPAGCRRNSSTMAMLWPWRVCAVLVQGADVSELQQLGQASSWPMYMHAYVWVCITAKGKAFGSPRLEGHISDHGVT